MSKNLQKYLQSIPWSRIVHWYGRATEFPSQIERLLSEDEKNKENIYQTIENNIKHQDGVAQASPFMVQGLILLLNEDGIDRERILSIIKRVYDAAQFQLEGRKPPMLKLSIAELRDLLREEFLWEEFESEERDEELWEEDVDQELWKEQNYWWNTFCRNMVEKSKIIKD